jgi:hypothetical protein
VDLDAGFALTYISSYPTDVLGVFVVDGVTGEIIVVGSIDYERKQSYTFTVQ